MLTDVEIAQQAKIKPVTEIAQKLNLTVDDLELYGKFKAKISSEVSSMFSGKKILAHTPKDANELD